jgi:hypothetical protein
MSIKIALRSMLLISACATLTGLGLAQTTWYIDVNATPPGNGTLASPYTDIQYALDQSTTVSGDLLLVAPGTYNGSVTLEKAVTLRSIQGPWSAVIRGGVGMPRDLLPGAPTLEGFSIVGHPTQNSNGIWMEGGFVRRCIVRDHKGNGSSSGFGIRGGDLGSGPVGVIQCTIVNNAIGVAGEPLQPVPVDSSILFGSTLEEGYNFQAFYTLVGGSGPSFGTNLTGDPQLWDLPTSDVHLGPLSPCIDVGNPSLPPDPDGSRADMGALPFSASYLPPIAVYCTGKVNSQGCAASIGASGGPAASMSSSSPFLVTCTNVVEGVPGLLFWGRAPRAVPFMGGFHCVQPPTPRATPQFAGSTGTTCSGSFSFDFNAYAQSGVNPTLAAGQVIRAQYWYRDPNDPLGFFAATSDAVEFPLGL